MKLITLKTGYGDDVVFINPEYVEFLDRNTPDSVTVHMHDGTKISMHQDILDVAKRICTGQGDVLVPF